MTLWLMLMKFSWISPGLVFWRIMSHYASDVNAYIYCKIKTTRHGLYDSFGFFRFFFALFNLGKNIIGKKINRCYLVVAPVDWMIEYAFLILLIADDVRYEVFAVQFSILIVLIVDHFGCHSYQLLSVLIAFHWNNFQSNIVLKCWGLLSVLISSNHFWFIKTNRFSNMTLIFSSKL